MAIDYEKVSEYLAAAEKVEETLEAKQELFDPEKLVEFKQVTSDLRKKIEIAQQKSRKLIIGIVGPMKAGKSSFLNECIFGGKDFLPKAATPMTASLTKITYSETPKAVVHYYTREDWEKVKENSVKYNNGLNDAYNEYLQKQSQAQQLTQSGYAPVPLSFMSLEDFEKTYNASEVQKAAKELTHMADKNIDVLEDKLGTTDTIEGDIMEKLNDYVGAAGTYTPIVSYVELQTNDLDDKDLEIVDTPGLSDPILSRGIETKQFLRTCDVVLLLSPCSQFMDAQTITLMANTLPSSGVQEVLVIGSKLDNGILNESSKKFDEAYRNSRNCYKTQYEKSLAQIHGGKHKELINKINQSKDSPLFISSVCCSIYRKNRYGVELDETEEHILKKLKELSGFEDKYLKSIGGISAVQNALKSVRNRKNELINNKNDKILETAIGNHKNALQNIYEEIVSSRKKLDEMSAGELQNRIEKVENVIKASRNKLKDLFDSAAIQCQNKVNSLIPELAKEQMNHQDLNIIAVSHDEIKEFHTGFLGLRKEIEKSTITDHQAQISDVINNIQQYAAKCQSFVNDNFNYIFNKGKFTNEIINVVLEAFHKSERDFDGDDDIRIPLQNVLDKISIANIDVDSTRYIDELEVRFENGYAENNEIRQLANIQSRLLNDINKDIKKQLDNAIFNISNTLSDQAKHFADHIEATLSNELKKLQGQMSEKENYIKKYEEFADEIRELKASLSNQ